MKHLLLPLLLVASSVHAFDVNGNTLTLTPDEVKQCEKGKGCFIVSKTQLEKMVADAFKEGQAQQRKSSNKIDKLGDTSCMKVDYKPSRAKRQAVSL